MGKRTPDTPEKIAQYNTPEFSPMALVNRRRYGERRVSPDATVGRILADRSEGYGNS